MTIDILNHVNEQTYSVSKATLEVMLKKDDRAYHYALTRAEAATTVRATRFWQDVATMVLAVEKEA